MSLQRRTRLIVTATALGTGAVLVFAVPAVQGYSGPYGTVTSANHTYTMPYTEMMTPTIEAAIDDAFDDGSLRKFSASQDQPTIGDVLAASNHTLYWKADDECDAERWAISPLDATHSVGAWCWPNSDQEGDKGSFAEADWNTQDVTSSVEAKLAGYSGPDAVLVSWYRPSNMTNPPTTENTGSRLTFVNKPLTQADTTYRRVLLVKPIIENGELSVEHVETHAGGVAWLGNYVYVAQARRIAVFDLRHIYSLYSDDSDSIGRQANGRINAHAYPFVMFQVGEFSNANCTWTPATLSDGLCSSGISVNPTTTTLVSMEHRTTGDMTSSGVGARIVSWPIDNGTSSPTRGLLQLTSGSAVSESTIYTTPTPNLQGVVREGNNVYMSRSKPTLEGMIYHTTLTGSTVTRTRPWMPHAEGIAWTSANIGGVPTGRLWGVNETLGGRWLAWTYLSELRP